MPWTAMAYMPLRKAVERLGLHPNTLRKYADDGTIPSIRTKAGQRLFDVDAWLRIATGATIICYCRVSSHKQRDDLERQIERMRKVYPGAEVVKDIASGLNFKRKGLRSVLERLLRGDKLKLVVAHRDRLARFGFDLFRFLVERNGGEILVLDQGVGSPESELTEDLLAILHHFSCRMHGQRSHKGKADKNLPEPTTAVDVSAMVRDFTESLQRHCGAPEPAEGVEGEELDGCSEGGFASPSGLGKACAVSGQEDIS
ncbi:putative resolvase [uncultured Gammaproteobacteria bacterium]